MELFVAGIGGIAIGFGAIMLLNALGHGPDQNPPPPERKESSGGGDASGGCLKLIIAAIVLAFLLPMLMGGK